MSSLLSSLNYVLQNSSPIFDTQVGREKAIRLVQYFLMFYIPEARENKSKYLEKCNIIERNCGLTRKVLRFGLEIPIVIGIIKRFR